MKPGLKNRTVEYIDFAAPYRAHNAPNSDFDILNEP